LPGTTAINVYLDGTRVYDATGTSMNNYISATTGNHAMMVKCWVGKTSYSSSTYNFNVAQEAGNDQVPVSAPFVNATVGAPFSVIADCNVSGATSVQVYLDSALVYSVEGTSIDYNQSASAGNHQLEVRCSAGGTPYSSGVFPITVAAPNGSNQVIVSSPLPNSTVGTTFSAIASCNVPNADAMEVYLDSNLVYAENVTSMNANLTTTIGNHQLTFKCWAGNNASASGPYQFAVGPQGGTAQVVVSSPLAGTREAPSFNVTSNCNIAGATATQVYLDSALVYSTQATAINYLATAAPTASHNVEVRCLVGGTPYSSGVILIDPPDTADTTGFSGSPNIPIPPSYAYYVGNIENMSNWVSGTGAVSSCANGVVSATCNPPNANYSLPVLQVPDPAPLPGSDGSAGQFALFSGPAMATVIWKSLLLSNATVSNFIWDLEFYVDSQNFNGSELDLYTTQNGQRFMIGSVCNYPANSWDTWNDATQQWIHNHNVPCKDLLTVNNWHHVTFYATADLVHGSYTYQVMRIDNTDYVLNQTQYAEPTGWAMGHVGFQVQLDANATGSGVNEYLEGVHVYAW
jgi:hypothetical protein